MERAADEAAAAVAEGHSMVSVQGTSGVGIARDERDDVPLWKKILNPLYQKALERLPKEQAQHLENLNEAARLMKDELGVSDAQLNKLVEEAQPLIRTANAVVNAIPAPPPNAAPQPTPASSSPPSPNKPTVRVDLDRAEDEDGRYVSDLRNPIGGRFQAIADDFKTHGIGTTILHRLTHGAVTDTLGNALSKATDFSHFTEVGPARQAFLTTLSPVPLPYDRPTVDPATGATDYQGQKEWDKGEATGMGLHIAAMGIGRMSPPSNPGPELAWATGGGTQTAPTNAIIMPSALFSKAPNAAGQTEEPKPAPEPPERTSEPVQPRRIAEGVSGTNPPTKTVIKPDPTTARPKGGEPSTRDKAVLERKDMRPQTRAYPSSHRHHIFPQQFRAWFEAKLQSLENIDEYVTFLSEGEHSAVHASKKGTTLKGWNNEWKEWIDSHQEATPQDIFEQGGRMMDKYHLNENRLGSYE